MNRPASRRQPDESSGYRGPGAAGKRGGSRLLKGGVEVAGYDVRAEQSLTEIAERLYAAAADAGRGTEDLASVMIALEAMASRN